MAMFNFSRRVDYGLAMLALLVRRGEDGRVTLAELSDMGMPRAFMAQIAKSLVKSRILISKEGRGGGYTLKRKPEEINLRDAIVAIGGEVSPVICVEKKIKNKKCPFEGACVQRDFMNRLSEEIGEKLGAYTLMDIAQKSDA